MPYKPTGRPNGRPPSLPSNLGDLIMEDLRSRMDPVTRMVLPCLSALERKLGVSRSSLKRTMKRLRDNGLFELVHVKSKPEAKVYTIYYKINESVYLMRSGYLPTCIARPTHGGSSTWLKTPTILGQNPDSASSKPRP